jgi:hypothetical protein
MTTQDNVGVGTRVKTWAGDLWDRVSRTGLQVFAAYLTITMQVGGPPFDWKAALSQTGFAMVASAITSAISFPSLGDALWYQYLERGVKTFLQTMAAGIATATLFEQVDWASVVDMSWQAAVYSLATSIITSKMGLANQVNVSAPVRVERQVLGSGDTRERTGGSGF